MKIILRITVFISLFLISCRNKTENVEEVKHYFDLKKYFTEQGVLLKKQHGSLQKQITKDGKTEVKTLVIVNWENELHPFYDCDINKPSWIHSYFQDTSFVAGEMRVKYVAREKKLPVRQLLISFEDNQLKNIYIEKENANGYYHSKNIYTYHPSTGFTITGLQEVMLTPKTDYSIKAQFIRL